MEFPVVDLSNEQEKIRALALFASVSSMDSGWRTDYIIERAASFEKFITGEDKK